MINSMNVCSCVTSLVYSLNLIAFCLASEYSCLLFAPATTCETRIDLRPEILYSDDVNLS